MDEDEHRSAPGRDSSWVGDDIFSRRGVLHFRADSFEWRDATTLEVAWPVLPRCEDLYANRERVGDVSVIYDRRALEPIEVKKDAVSPQGSHIATHYFPRDCRGPGGGNVELRRVGVDLGQGVDLFQGVYPTGISRVELEWIDGVTVEVAYRFNEYDFATARRGSSTDGHWTRHEVDGIRILYEARRRKR